MSNPTKLIRVTVNGKPQEIPSGLTLLEHLVQRKVRPELVTVEVNGNILQKLDYESLEIKNGDKIEFAFYMGGGA